MNDQITFLKEQIKGRYSALRIEIMKYYHASAKDEEAFEKAANTCYKNNLDPVIYVDAHAKEQIDLKTFYATFLNRKDPETDFEIYELYKNNTIPSETNYERMLDSQLVYLRNQLKLGLTTEQALLDPQVDFKPWFRILITADPIPKIIEKYANQVNLTADLLEFLKTQPKFNLTRLGITS